MDVWIDVWMDGCMDEWMDGCMYGWMDGWTTMIYIAKFKISKVTVNLVKKKT